MPMFVNGDGSTTWLPRKPVPTRRFVATVEVDGPLWLMASVNADDVDLEQTICLKVLGREEEVFGTLTHVREEVA